MVVNPMESGVQTLVKYKSAARDAETTSPEEIHGGIVVQNIKAKDATTSSHASSVASNTSLKTSAASSKTSSTAPPVHSGAGTKLSTGNIVTIVIVSFVAVAAI
jgi:hypothetical protein